MSEWDVVLGRIRVDLDWMIDERQMEGQGITEWIERTVTYDFRQARGKMKISGWLELSGYGMDLKQEERLMGRWLDE